MDYARPVSLSDAVAELGVREMMILSGGTDVYPALRDRPLSKPTLDISRIKGLRGITTDAAGWRIGAATTWTDVARADLPPCFDALKAAARDVGSPQIQNIATLAGNLCNASPAADGVPPLLALDASVELASRSGTRTFPLSDFISGPRRTMRAPDEIMTAILVPRPSGADVRSAFFKLGSRAHLVISITMVAVVIGLDETGRIAKARIAVGACSPVARRLPALERELVGTVVGTDDLAARVLPEHLVELAPIDDVRASADYRRLAALEVVRRVLVRAAGSGRSA